MNSQVSSLKKQVGTLRLELRAANSNLATSNNGLSAVAATLATKANSQDLVNGLASKAAQTEIGRLEGLIAGKANSQDLTSGLAGKASNAALNTKAEQSEIGRVEGLINGKASIASVNTKAELTVVNTALGLKADQTVVTTALGLKADQTVVNTALGFKANQTSVVTITGRLDGATGIDAKVTGLVNRNNTIAANTSDTIRVAFPAVVISGVGGITSTQQDGIGKDGWRCLNNNDFGSFTPDQIIEGTGSNGLTFNVAQPGTYQITIQGQKNLAGAIRFNASGLAVWPMVETSTNSVLNAPFSLTTIVKVETDVFGLGTGNLIKMIRACNSTGVGYPNPRIQSERIYGIIIHRIG